MEISSKDNTLINNIIERAAAISQIEAKSISDSKIYTDCHNRLIEIQFEHPLDSNCIAKLSELLSKGTNDLYRNISDLKDIWYILMDKSIKCLRFFDSREPYFKNSGTNPQAYGLSELKDYYEEFADFEALLYGSNRFYRDHVIHLFRTWLIGINILISETRSEPLFQHFHFEGVNSGFTLNFFEVISIWTIAALCHDLGYPLEKSQNIIHKTEKMMRHLVSQPNISHNVNFSGTQDAQNNFILKLLSSKMRPCETKHATYIARLQSKYFMKYSKSLESYKHGIISSIIIYKSLLYFLESDFSLHDDYIFDHKEAHHYYIKRDILRSISSHTCKDIYHMQSTTFPLLLIVADELQEWGRKRWSDLYRNSKIPSTNFMLLNYDKENISVEFTFNKVPRTDSTQLITSFYKQFSKFRLLFRDGQDTELREFDFYFIYIINTTTNRSFKITSYIPSKNPAVFKISSTDYSKSILLSIAKDLQKGLLNDWHYIEEKDEHSIYIH